MSERIKFMEAIRALYVETNIAGKWGKYRDCWKQIAAQWALESGYGSSKLARIANNFAGLKWRKELDEAGIQKYKYSDWANDEDCYFYVSNPADFVDLYFRFIERPVYDGISIAPDEIIFELANRGFVGSLPGYEPPTEKERNLWIAREYERRVKSILKSKKFNDFLTEIMCFPEIADTLDEYERIMMPDFGYNSGNKLAEMPKAEVKMSWYTDFRDEVVGEVKQSVIETAGQAAIKRLFQVFFRNKDGRVIQKTVDAEIKEQIEAQKAEIRYYRAQADEYRRCLGLGIDLLLENNITPEFVLNEPVKPDWLK